MPTFYKLHPDGRRIHMVLTQLQRDPPPGMIEAATHEERAMLAQPTRILWDSGNRRFRFKPRVRLVPSQATLRADGVDAVVVEIRGANSEFSMAVQVEGQRGRVRVADGIRVTSRREGPIRVRLLDPYVESKELVLMATDPAEAPA